MLSLARCFPLLLAGLAGLAPVTGFSQPSMADLNQTLTMVEGEDQITIQFRNVKLTPPAATSFTIPQGLTRFNTVHELMGVAMARMLIASPQ